MQKTSDKYSTYPLKKIDKKNESLAADGHSRDVKSYFRYTPPDESSSSYFDISREIITSGQKEKSQYLTEKTEKVDSAISNFSNYFTLWIYLLMIISIAEVKNRAEAQASLSGSWIFANISMTFLSGLYVLSAFKNKIMQHATIACYLFLIQIFVKIKIYLNDDPKLLYQIFIDMFEKIDIDFVKNFNYFAIIMIVIHLLVTTMGAFKLRSLLKQRDELQDQLEVENKMIEIW